MRVDPYNAATLAVKRNTGPFYGAPAFGTVSGVGMIYPPHWAIPLATSGTFSTTAGRLYYIPYFFPEIVSYTGLKMRNLGSGDNGEVLRLGVYQRDASTHLPSTLVADAGEITLTGAAADGTLATAFTPAYIGWHYLAYHANTAADIMGLCTALAISAVGSAIGNPNFAFMGAERTNINIQNGTGGQGGAAVLYVATTYGALASTAVAPTASLQVGPWAAPYRT